MPLDGQSSLVSSAEARIGRPLTPMSYAGLRGGPRVGPSRLGPREPLQLGLTMQRRERPHARKWPMPTGGSSRSADKVLNRGVAVRNQHSSIWRRQKIKLSSSLSALLIAGFVVAGSEPASAVVYCQYVSYPAGCIVRPGVVLRPRPVVRAVAREAVRPGTPMNRGGPVNRVGRR
jgi:hypothetical protein